MAVLLALLLALPPAAAVAAAALLVRRLAPEERLVVGLALLAFALSAVLSPVSYVHDNFTHFRHARLAFEEPRGLLDLWDRPAFMLLYSGPARLGLTAARLASLAPAAIALAGTVLAARAAGLARPWLAAVLVAAQYDFFGQASSTMTELLLAAGLSVATWAFLADRPWLAAVGLACGALARPEAPLLLAAPTLALWWRHRRLGPPLLVAGAFVAYVAMGSLVFRDPLWLLHGNPYAGQVGLRLQLRQLRESYFYEALLLGQPLPLLALCGAGALLALREGGRRAALLLGPVAALWLLLTFLRIGPHDWWRQARYTVSVAPLLALLALRAHEEATRRLPRLAEPLLLALAGAAAGVALAKAWRPLLAAPPGLPAAVALGLAAAGALLLARRVLPPAAALALLLAAPLVSAPPGTFGAHRPTPGERAAEAIVPRLAASHAPAVAYDHGSLEPVCAALLGDPGHPCPLSLAQRPDPAAGDTLFVKQYDGTWEPPGPPPGWREVWRAEGPRVEGPLDAPVSWRSTTMIWERAPAG